MKISDVIKQLAATLPKHSDLFSDNQAVSLSYNAGTVTGVTTSPHNLSTNDAVTITGAPFITNIQSITRAGNIATVTTVTPHDLTAGYQKTVNQSGADQPEYNGDLELINVLNRTTYTVKVSGTPISGTGSMILNEARLGFSGRFSVSVLDANTFAYQSNVTLNGPSTGIIKTNIRVSGGVTYDRVLESYTKHLKDNLYCFVVPQPSVISRNRNVLNDANDAINSASTFQIREIESFTLYVFVPSSDISGRIAHDQIEDISQAIYKSILGVKMPTYLFEDRWAGITLLGHGFHAYNGALYIHAYEMQSIRDIVSQDAANVDDSVAYRQTDISIINEFETEIMTAIADNDEVQL